MRKIVASALVTAGILSTVLLSQGSASARNIKYQYLGEYHSRQECRTAGKEAVHRGPWVAYRCTTDYGGMMLFGQYPDN